nr:SH3 domain-containing protein [Leeia oryzae]
MPDFRTLIAISLGGLVAMQASAVEYRSASKNGVVLYEAPASSAKKRFVVSAGYPAEVVITQNDWLKLRDRNGMLAWGVTKDWSDRRTVVVVADKTALYGKPDASASITGQLNKDVWLQLLPASAAAPGWVHVQHKSGVSGWVRVTDVWGM